MSIKVPLDEVGAEASLYGFAYLLTSATPRPRVLAVWVESDGETLVMEVSVGTAARIADQPEVTLVWPPAEADGMSLIVDGDGTVEGNTLRVRPINAVLHRPAPGLA